MHEAASPRFQRGESGSSDGAYVLYVGGISPNKNLATLIRAFSRLQARARGVRLILVGDYESDGFKSCYGALTELVQSLGLSREVQFTGFVPDEELCRLYNGAGLFVLPSFDEGFGLPAIEAMACGLPVIVSAGNAMEEVVGDAGLIVDPNDEVGLTAHMDRLLGNTELRREFGEKGIRRAAEFSWESAARNLLGIFEDTRNGKFRG
jgi:glycosyltransferase involved in cell wall biosynthesis